jgi:hypothetical protein
MEEHYTGCQRSMPYVLKGAMQFFSASQYRTWLGSQAADFFDRGIRTYS